MGGIKDHREAERLHADYRTHVRDEVAVPEAYSSFGQENLPVSGTENLLHCVLHVFSREELALFYVNHFTGSARGQEEIRLATKERGYLDHIE